MATQIYTFKITYADCGNKIWRTVAVSSNYTLADLGYLVLATFDTMAYHLFEMEYGDTMYFLDGDDPTERFFVGQKHFGMLSISKLGRLGMKVGDVIKMTYDLGCCQEFEIVLSEIRDKSRYGGRAYPKILDGAGRGIIDDMPPEELLEIIQKIDAGGRSEIFYPINECGDVPEWDYRNYSIDLDNALLRGTIEDIRFEYEDFETDF